MSQTWGRPDSAGTWPRPKPVSTLATLMLAVVAGTAIGSYQYAATWTPLARWYLPSYLRSAVMAGLGVTTTGRYRLLQVVGGTGSRLALDEEVRPVTTDTGQATFALTETAVHLGDRQLAWQDRSYNHQQLHAFLGRWIYRDQTLMDLVIPALWGAVGVFLAGLLIAIPRDLARSRERRHGRRLRGPELLTPAQFNRRTPADGIGFRQQRPAWRRTPSVRLPRAIESSHLLLMGDSGTGKSGLIRQLLQQVDARGDTAIVYDPAREFTPEFYTPDRGDVILNPLDTRSPYWNPADEVRQDAEALTVAASLFPDRHQDKEFFTEGPRRLFAHLLRIGLSLEELTAVLCHEDELDRRVRGTTYAPMIAPQAPQQRSGIIASFNMVADALQLLPREQDTTSRWSTTAWSRDRQGWVFLPSTPDTREPLIPLVSWWLDLLVLRLMQQGRHPRPTWFVLDELASLQRLPQLHTAITENRKSGNPVVLGFQGRSQLETRYGGDAKTILSQPATKIFFRTSEADGAKWIAETIGNIEIERLRESRSHGRGDQQSYGLERQTEPLVMDSEITGLPNLHGYLKLGNLVVRLHVPFVDVVTRAPALIERIPPRRDRPAAAGTATGTPTSERPGPSESGTSESRRLGAGHARGRIFG
jgi:hypothetical protein